MSQGEDGTLDGHAPGPSTSLSQGCSIVAHEYVSFAQSFALQRPTHSCCSELCYATRLTAESQLRLVAQKIKRVRDLLGQFREHLQAVHTAAGSSEKVWTETGRLRECEGCVRRSQNRVRNTRCTCACTPRRWQRSQISDLGTSVFLNAPLQIARHVSRIFEDWKTLEKL